MNSYLRKIFIDYFSAACPQNKYGENCDNQCHCFQNKPCDSITGQCPNKKCTFGWTGSTCSEGILKQ